MSKIKRITWIQTRILDKDDNILLLFINELYHFPEELHIGKKSYIKTATVDEVVKKGILRKIYVRAI